MEGSISAPTPGKPPGLYESDDGRSESEPVLLELPVVSVGLSNQVEELRDCLPEGLIAASEYSKAGSGLPR
jgi:hypothetical protein